MSNCCTGLQRRWEALAPQVKMLRKHQIAMWVLTFFIYAVFHLTRKSYSIVKGSLNPKADSPAPGWAPFNESNGKTLLGGLDSVFIG